MVSRKIPVLIISCLILISCSDFTRNSYRTLVVSNQTYDAIFSALGDLYKNGKITEYQKEKAIEIGKVYKNLHNKSVTALEDYVNNPTENSKQAYITIAGKASKALSDLVTYAKPFLERE